MCLDKYRPQSGGVWLEGGVRAFKRVATRPNRPDGLDKVTGRAKFGADMSAPGMPFASVVRSPHPHARILRIDTPKAEAMKGVKAVVTRERFAKNITFKPGLGGELWSVL